MKLLFSVGFMLISLCGLGSHVLIDSTTQMIEQGKGAAFDIQPGDTIFLLPGTYRNLRLLSLKGTRENPIVITNHPSGIALIKSDHYYGISFNYCEYVKLNGKGSKDIEYGIEIADVNGNGIGGTRGSFGLSINNIYIHDVAGAGIQIKTDATCNEFNRSDFIIKDISISNCLIKHVGTEGLYIGSTQFQPFTIECDGEIKTLSDPLIQNLSIYSNHVSHTGWDAIQVASSINSVIHNNFIEFDSQAKSPNQMSGIAIGAGANPTVYNNTIQFGNGNGISSFGLGGVKIYNNIILEPGFGFKSIYGKYGIYFNNKEDNTKNKQTIVAHNLIVSANVGMKFDRSYPDSNDYYVYNNLIVEPRDLSHYSAINQAERAYIQTPFLEVHYKGNLHLDQLKSNWFTGSHYLDFHPTWESGIIDSGEEIPHFKIKFDMNNVPRVQGNKPDAGPFESPYEFNSELKKNAIGKLVFQNPITSPRWQWTLDKFNEGNLEICLYNSKGISVKQWTKTIGSYRESFILDIPSSTQNGMYLVTIRQGSKRISKTVIIQLN